MTDMRTGVAADYAAELDRAASMINDLLHRETLPGTVRPAALADAVRAYPERCGKRLRPALLLWSCGLVGGDPAKARHAALAVELYHNWTLVHDDIIDRDETRRGQPACQVLLRESYPGARKTGAAAKRHGCDQAMLAGDIQHGWAVDTLARGTGDGIRPEIALALVRRLCGTLTPALLSGEALDVEFAAGKAMPSATAIEHMIALKTGALLRFAAQAGVLIGLDSSDFDCQEARNLGDFAENAGVAFQLLDDWLGVFGDSAELGKPVGADLREGKKTLLLCHALTMATPAARRELRRLAGNPRLDAAGLDRARTLIRDSGAETALLTNARRLADSAQNLLLAFPANPYRDRLGAWLNALVNRRR